MAINYTPQYSLLATVTGLTNAIIISATNAVPVNVVAGGAGDGRILDGSDTNIKATVFSYTNASPIAVRLSDTTGAYVTPAGGSGITSVNNFTFILSVTNVATSPLTISGTTIAITSLPNLGLDSRIKIVDGSDTNIKASVLSYPNISPLAVRLTDTSGNYVSPAGGSGITSVNNFTFIPTITNLASNPLTVSGTTIAITSLPPLGAATVSVNNFTFVLSITNLASLPLTISGTTIAITSLPPIPIHSISGLTSASVSISNLSTIIQIVSGTTIAITSLPALGFGGSVSVSGLTSASVSLSNMSFFPTITNAGVTASVLASIGAFPVQIVPAKTTFSYTATFTSGQTYLAIKPIPGSVTAYYVTDIIVSNENTAGNVLFMESSSNFAVRSKIERLYLAANGGAVINFTDGLNWNTNSSIVFDSNTVTNHSVTIIGYTA